MSKQWKKFDSMEQAAEHVKNLKTFRQEGILYDSYSNITVKVLFDQWRNWEYPVERKTRDLYLWDYREKNSFHRTVAYYSEDHVNKRKWTWKRKIESSKITIDAETGEVVE